MIDQNERDRVRTVISDSLDVAPSVPSSTDVPQPVETTDRLAVSDWVIASLLPAEYEFLYARRKSPADGERHSRVVAYGLPRDGSDENSLIEIGGVRSSISYEIVTLAGVDWTIGTLDPEWWSASRLVGEATLNVRGAGEMDEAVLGGLLVMDETGLPFVPLGGPDDAALVVRTELGDEVYSYAVQESGRGVCNWVTSSTGSVGGCGSGAGTDAVITIAGYGTAYPDGARRSVEAASIGFDAAGWGSVTSAAVSVEVEFADGTVVTVEPTDLSGSFDKLFWIAAATVNTDSQTTSSISNAGVTEVRAHDADGSHLGSAAPSWLEHPDDEQ